MAARDDLNDAKEQLILKEDDTFYLNVPSEADEDDPTMATGGSGLVPNAGFGSLGVTFGLESSRVQGGVKQSVQAQIDRALVTIKSRYGEGTAFFFEKDGKIVLLSPYKVFPKKLDKEAVLTYYEKGRKNSVPIGDVLEDAPLDMKLVNGRTTAGRINNPALFVNKKKMMKKWKDFKPLQLSNHPDNSLPKELLIGETGFTAQLERCNSRGEFLRFKKRYESTLLGSPIFVTEDECLILIGYVLGKWTGDRVAGIKMSSFLLVYEGT